MKLDFLTTPHSYTRTPRSYKEAHGQHLPISQRTWIDALCDFFARIIR